MIEAIREIEHCTLKKEGKFIDEPFWIIEITFYTYSNNHGVKFF